MSTCFGVVGEDPNDCSAIGVLVKRIAKGDHGATVGIKPRKCKGASHLERKIKPHLLYFSEVCQAAIVVRDLDLDPNNHELNDHAKLHRKLTACASHCPSSFPRHICIPIEEIEAWFWSDQNLLNRLCKHKPAKASLNPHRIKEPKERLIEASRMANAKPLYFPARSKELAAQLDLDVCAERCNAFRDLRSFVGSVLTGF